MHDRRTCLWYRRPAESWVEGFPLGNGRVGAMVQGGINRDHIYLNEETIWAGSPGDCIRPDAGAAMKKLKRSLFAGESREAEQLVMNQILPEKRWFGSYEPFGDLEIRFLDTLEYDSYERCLDLKRALATAAFTEQNEAQRGCWKKEYLVSAPHQVLAVRYEADREMNLEIAMSRDQEGKVESPENGTLLLKGRLGETGICFAGMLKAVIQEGTMELIQIRPYASPVLRIHGAKTVDLFVSVRTSFLYDDYEQLCRKDVEKAVLAGYETVRKAHEEEYRGYYERFELCLGEGKEQEDFSTYERLCRIRKGGQDPDFYALLVHYYRYLLLSASRPGCLPSNLQGLWNHRIVAPWESDYHANVNLEINYWPAEAFQLGECHTALFDWLERIRPSGEETAKNYYGVGGWTLHHASNVFGHTAPCAVAAGLWPMGAGWLVRHLYEHSLYHDDERFLEEQAYPLMKGAARFFLEFLEEAPEGTDGAGYLVTNPSHSPENKFYGKDGTITSFTYGASMDIQIIRDLFHNCLDVIRRLRKRKGEAFEEDFETKLRETLHKLPPICVSRRTGGIQEWIGDYEELDPGHRHISHLYGLFPARLIDTEKTPELAAAAKRTLERKLAHSYDGQGWSYGWMSCLFARLREPEQAYWALEQVVKKHMLHNLFLEAHGNPQVGDGQVIPAAVLEMLVQFDGNKIILLPALPEEWKNGWVKGLKTVGGYVIDMVWKDGRITELVIHDEQVFCPYPIDAGQYIYKEKEREYE